MYTELTCIGISYEDITYVYEKAHITVIYMIFRLDITKLSCIKNIMF